MNKNNKPTNVTKLCAGIILTTVMLAGCTGSQWQKAAAASDDLITIVAQAQDVEIEFYHDGLVEKAEHIQVQTVFRNIAQADKHLNQAIRSGASGKDAFTAYRAAVDATDTALKDGTFNIKNKSVAASLQAAIAASRVVLTTIKTIAQGK